MRNRTVPSLWLLASLSLAPGGLAACGGSGDGTPPAPASADDPGPIDGAPGSIDGAGAAGGSRDRARGSTPEAESIGARPHASEELGALHGEIRFAGDAPERFPIGARQKTECTHHPEVEHMSDTVVVNDGRLGYAFVTLRSGWDEASVPPAPAEPLGLDQRGCVYTPHVLGIQAGRELHVKNSDPTNHNVNYKAPRNGATGNRNMGSGQQPLVLRFDRAETGIRFKCDIHPWMLSWVHVQEHPWFAVSDERGEFSILDVPPGEYVVEAIHERFGKQRGRVEVRAGESTGFALTFTAGD